MNDRADDTLALSSAMERFARGDASAFAEIYRLLGPRLFLLCRRLCGSAADPQDLFQETFFKLHRARATFVEGSNVVHWAFAIARSVHVDAIRRGRRRPALETFPAIETFPMVAGEFASPEANFDAAEIARLVEKTLFEMPEPQRAAFILTREEGLSAAEAGSVLGASETAIRLRVMRARDMLRAAIEGARL